MIRMLVWLALGLAALWFALSGGEFSTLDILRQRERLAALTRRADSLAAVVDSLRAVERRVRTDPATQERIAREEFGMIRRGEVLYRFAPARRDSTPRPDR